MTRRRPTVRLALYRESVGERRAQMYMAGEYPLGVTRPRSRAECEPGSYGHGRRPCPWVGCKYHLALDVVPTDREGQPPSLDVRREDLEELPHTCALDVAEFGGMTLDEVGEVLGLSRERVRQIEAGALRKLRRIVSPEWADGLRVGDAPATLGLALGGGPRTAPDADDDDPDDADEPLAVERRLAWDLTGPDFGEAADSLACSNVYAAYARALTATTTTTPNESTDDPRL